MLPITPPTCYALSCCARAPARWKYDGANFTRLPPHTIVARGIAHVPEGHGILSRRTVLDNLKRDTFVRRDGEIGRDLEELSERFPILRELSRPRTQRAIQAIQAKMAQADQWLSRAGPGYGHLTAI